MFKSLMPRLREKSLATRQPSSIADLMEDFWREPFSALPALFKDVGFPAVDVSEDEKTVTVKAELPGLDVKDVEITIHNDTLVLKGEKKFEEEEKKDNYHRIERSYGSFSRSIPLPCQVKEAETKAKFDKGILTITMPKDEAAQPRKITIES